MIDIDYYCWKFYSQKNLETKLPPMKKSIVTSILMLGFIIAVAQDSKVNVGVGAGLDYGGFGTRIGLMASERVGLFAGLGYNLDGLGYNIGAQFHFPSEKRTSWYITGMYGYNAVLVVTGDIEKEKTYYGPSFGAGIQRKAKSDIGFWNFALLIPIRSSEFQDDIDALNSFGADVTEPLPISFSIGYHWKF
jgi:hypothetical protein